MKYFREIRAVGLFNWIWFCIYLQRNEFHPYLDMPIPMLSMEEYNNRVNKIAKLRRRAHNINVKLREVVCR